MPQVIVGVELFVIQWNWLQLACPIPLIICSGPRLDEVWPPPEEDAIAFVAMFVQPLQSGSFVPVQPVGQQPSPG